jgi:hypothetical protein
LTTALAAWKALLEVGGFISVLSVILYGFGYIANTAGDCNPCRSPFTWFAYPFLFGLCLIALGLAFWFRSRGEKPRGLV